MLSRKNVKILTLASPMNDELQSRCAQIWSGSGRPVSSTFEERTKRVVRSSGHLEHVKAKAKKGSQASLAEAKEVIIEQHQREEALERDLSQVRNWLAASEADLAWVRQEFDREDREASLALRQLGDEIRVAQIALEKAVRDEQGLSRKVGDAGRRDEQERARLMRELESARAASAHVEARPSTTSFSQRAILGVLDDVSFGSGEAHDVSRPRASLARSASLGSVTGASCSSRAMGRPDGPRPEVVSTLSTELDTHIQRLHRHTEELRSSLRPGQAGNNGLDV